MHQDAKVQALGAHNRACRHRWFMPNMKDLIRMICRGGMLLAPKRKNGPTNGENGRGCAGPKLSLQSVIFPPLLCRWLDCWPKLSLQISHFVHRCCADGLPPSTGTKELILIACCWAKMSLQIRWSWLCWPKLSLQVSVADPSVAFLAGLNCRSNKSFCSPLLVPMVFHLPPVIPFVCLPFCFRILRWHAIGGQLVLLGQNVALDKSFVHRCCADSW